MIACLRCHRQLKRPSESGYGPVCAKTAQPVPEVSRDLFGYDIDAACAAARAWLAEFIAARAARALHEHRAAFKGPRP